MWLRWNFHYKRGKRLLKQKGVSLRSLGCSGLPSRDNQKAGSLKETALGSGEVKGAAVWAGVTRSFRNLESLGSLWPWSWLLLTNVLSSFSPHPPLALPSAPLPPFYVLVTVLVTVIVTVKGFIAHLSTTEEVDDSMFLGVYFCSFLNLFNSQLCVKFLIWPKV